MPLLVDGVEPLLSVIHNPDLASIAASPIPQGSKVLLSETLFDEADKGQLRGVLVNNPNVEVLPPEVIKRRATNAKASKEKLACVLSRSEFDSLGMSHMSNNKATLLILEDSGLHGTNYLYVEGVVGLASARMSQDIEKTKRYMRLFCIPIEMGSDRIVDGRRLDEELKKDDTIEFSKRIRILLKPIEPFDTDELLNRYKIMVENYLMAA